MQITEREAHIMRLADQEYVTIGDKQFRFVKISPERFDELEDMKLELMNTTDTKEGTVLTRQILQKSALYYFNIPEDEYKKLSREDMGYAIEAGAYRAMYGKPFLSKKSTTGSGSVDRSESPTKPTESSPSTPDSKD